MAWYFALLKISQRTAARNAVAFSAVA